MPVPDRRPRPRPRRPDRSRTGLGTESLESRRLLVAPPINVAAGLVFATALPVPGLATGIGLASTAQTLPTVTVSVSPAPVAMAFGPSATGPSTTLSPLPNDAETALAPASEVARPTPGRSDRIASFVEAPEVVPILHLRSPDAVEVIPGPEIQAPPPAPAVPAQPPAGPADPARPVEDSPAPAPVPVPRAVPEEPTGPMALEVWDAAIHAVATDLREDAPASIVDRTGGTMAAGALLAAWGGWKFGPRLDGRSRKKPIAIAAVESGPGGGSGRR